MHWSSICCVTNSVRHTLHARFRSVPGDVVADATMEAQYRFCRKFYRPDDGEIPMDEPMAWRWMAVTAERILLRERQRAAVYQPLPSSDQGDDDAPPQKQSTVANSADIYHVEDDLAATLTIAALMNVLSPALAQVVRLHDIEGIPLEEIARDLGCTSASVRQRHARGLRGLRRLWHAESTRTGRCIGCDCGERAPGRDSGKAEEQG